MATNIPISVVLPAYNREAAIDAAIRSALAQAYPIHELLVVDDGSTDHTADVIRGHSRTDTRVKYIYQHNAGAAAARNRGFELAAGEWVAFLDSDDRWSENKLANAVRLIRQSPRLEFVHANKRYVYFHNGADDGRQPFAPIDCIDREYLLRHWAIKTSTVLIRRSLWQRLDRHFPVDMRTCEDYEFFWRAIVEAREIGYAPQCDTTITMTPGSMIRNGGQLHLLIDNITACGRAARWMEQKAYDHRYAEALRIFQYWQFRLLLAGYLKNAMPASAFRVWTRCLRELSALKACRALLSATRDALRA